MENCIGAVDCGSLSPLIGKDLTKAEGVKNVLIHVAARVEMKEGRAKRTLLYNTLQTGKSSQNETRKEKANPPTATASMG